MHLRSYTSTILILLSGITSGAFAATLDASDAASVAGTPVRAGAGDAAEAAPFTGLSDVSSRASTPAGSVVGGDAELLLSPDANRTRLADQSRAFYSPESPDDRTSQLVNAILRDLRIAGDSASVAPSEAARGPVDGASVAGSDYTGVRSTGTDAAAELDASKTSTKTDA